MTKEIPPYYFFIFCDKLTFPNRKTMLSCISCIENKSLFFTKKTLTNKRLKLYSSRIFSPQMSLFFHYLKSETHPTPRAEPHCPLGGLWPLQIKKKVQQSRYENWLALPPHIPTISPTPSFSFRPLFSQAPTFSFRLLILQIKHKVSPLTFKY